MAVRGLNIVLRNYQRVNARMKSAVKEGVTDSTLHLLGESKQQAPLDTGDLRGAGKSKVTQVGEDIVGTVSFNKPYALIQHEDMTFNHPKGGKAKYLSDPLNQNANRYKRYIQDKVRQVVR